MTALNLKDALSPVVSEGSIEVLENPYRTEQLLETFTSILPAGIAIVVNDDRDAGMRIARILSRKGYAVRVGTPDRDVIFGIRALRCSALVLDLAGISHVAPFSQVERGSKSLKGQVRWVVHQDHARQHEIESEWDMVAFDIAGRAVSRTHRSCRLHA